MKAKPETVKKKKREQEIAQRAFDYGKKSGKEEILCKLIELLELDERYQAKTE